MVDNLNFADFGTFMIFTPIYFLIANFSEMSLRYEVVKYKTGQDRAIYDISKKLTTKNLVIGMMIGGVFAMNNCANRLMGKVSNGLEWEYSNFLEYK